MEELLHLLLVNLTSLTFSTKNKDKQIDKTGALYFMHRYRDMQRKNRAEIHCAMALMRRAVRTWVCAVKMRGGSADSEEEGISTSESIGRKNAGINLFRH